jgi:hypothetical protein
MPSQGVSTFDRIMGAGPAFTASNQTELYVSFCQPGADIENLDGYLQCPAKSGSWGYLGAAPNGSYQMSCNRWLVQNVFVNGQNVTRLAANCRTFTDKTSTTEALLYLTNCQMGKDIENIKGTLLCAAAPAAPQQQGASQSQPAPGTCKQGYVWRQANPQDHVCVYEVSRQQAANDNASAPQYTQKTSQMPAPCIMGYVWREANAQDHVCVPPAVRAQTLQENQQAPSRTW